MTDQARDTSNTEADAAETVQHLPTTGGTLTGDLYLKSPPRRDFEGFASRSTRIILESYNRSSLPNNRSGDVMELRWREPDAKAFIGWWDYTDPENPSMKAWIGAHDKATDIEEAPHRHWSVEVANSEGDMKTRLAIPYGTDHTNIKTSSADFTVGFGVLRVAGSGGTNRDLEFANRPTAEKSQRRFTIRLDEKNDVRLISRNDEGDPIDRPVMFVRRLTGAVGFGTTNPERHIHIKAEQKPLLVEGTAPTDQSLVRFKVRGPETPALEVSVRGEEKSRFTVRGDGRLSWRDGRGGAPVVLKPASDGVLELEGDLEVSDANRGVILRDGGKRYRLGVSRGQLKVTAL
ncbi:hypothetical protein J4H92_03425 [Leucobacter weissii]|uniref:Uncharacterized protein n=1 Tax=Leucobacter weissii TaxID=1983706 RepID=A0A939S562_9MICO|nr:hypothetical protein [Leucobacter weissii]MBO1900999.1 hypothetical protein [Leucobacter weissii]